MAVVAVLVVATFVLIDAFHDQIRRGFEYTAELTGAEVDALVYPWVTGCARIFTDHRRTHVAAADLAWVAVFVSTALLALALAT